MTESGVSRIVLAVFIISASAFFFLKTRADPDLWGHVKFGEAICEKGEISRFDPYYYSSPHPARWINHEWLSEAVFYAILKHTGPTGLVLFKFFAGLFILYLIHFCVRTRTESVFLQLFFIIVPLSVIMRGLTIRPQIFTYFFFAVTVFIIDSLENADSSPEWPGLFPTIFLFWCNMHGGFLAGLGVFLLYTLFKIFIPPKPSPILFLAGLFSVLATLVNPYGPALWRFLFSSVTMRRPFITEWQTVEFSWVSLGYFIISIVTLAGIFFSRRKRSIYEITLLGIALYISFRFNRHTVLFAILAAVYMAAYLESAAGPWIARLERGFPRAFSNSIFICYSAFFVSGLFFNIKANPPKIKIRPNEYPVEAVDFFAREQDKRQYISMV